MRCIHMILFEDLQMCCLVQWEINFFEQRKIKSNIFLSSSKTIKPPIAFPVASFDAMYSHDSFRRSANVLPCTMGNKFCEYVYISGDSFICLKHLSSQR